MQSLRVDNDRLSRLVKKEHVSSSDSNADADVEASASKSHAHRGVAASDQKLPPSDFDDLSFPAKSLGMMFI